MPNRISLVGSFNLADGYLGAANALKRRGVEVEFVPAHLYKNEYKNKHINKIIEDLNRYNSDIVLWWRAETIAPAEMEYVRNKVKGRFILYSWDDPHQWEHMEYFVGGKMKHMDVAFSCCEGSKDIYSKYGCNKFVYCLPGFDPEIHYPEEDDNYKCDISVVCTNLYDGNQITKYNHVSRKELLEGIIKLFPEADIRIYGSEYFGDIFGERYKGWINFNESRKVFYNSKINICTHIRPDGYRYLNERVGQILGSRGLLFIDAVNGIETILENGKECSIIDLSSDDNLKNQISDILNNSERYDCVREAGYNFAMNYLTWDYWANMIIKNI
jgi:hypothetical protein